MRKFERSKTNEKPGGLFSWFSSPEAQPSRNGSGYLLPANVFQAHLFQERARADRSGSSFVVMTFGIETSQKNKALDHQAHEILAECVFNVFRLCDTKGWYEKKSEPVGVILPDTKANETAAPLARTEDLFAQLSHRRMRSQNGATRGPRLVCSIYSYPTQASFERPSLDNGNVDLRFKLNTIDCDALEELALDGVDTVKGDRRV